MSLSRIGLKLGNENLAKEEIQNDEEEEKLPEDKNLKKNPLNLDIPSRNRSRSNNVRYAKNLSFYYNKKPKIRGKIKVNFFRSKSKQRFQEK